MRSVMRAGRSGTSLFNRKESSSSQTLNRNSRFMTIKHPSNIRACMSSNRTEKGSTAFPARTELAIRGFPFNIPSAKSSTEGWHTRMSLVLSSTYTIASSDFTTFSTRSLFLLRPSPFSSANKMSAIAVDDNGRRDAVTKTTENTDSMSTLS